MEAKDFNNLKSGDIVFAVLNTGMTGISKYQYIGVFICHGNKEVKHVLLSEWFLSSITIMKGKENTSRNVKSIFLTEKEAIDYKKELIKLENIETDY